MVKGCITLKCLVNSVNVCQELAQETFQRPLLTYETRFVFAFLQLLSCNNSEKIFKDSKKHMKCTFLSLYPVIGIAGFFCALLHDLLATEDAGKLNFFLEF